MSTCHFELIQISYGQVSVVVHIVKMKHLQRFMCHVEVHDERALFQGAFFLFISSMSRSLIRFSILGKTKLTLMKFYSAQIFISSMFIFFQKLIRCLEYLMEYWMVFNEISIFSFWNSMVSLIDENCIFFHLLFVKKNVNKNQRRWNFTRIFWLTSKSQSSKIDIIPVMEIDFQGKKNDEMLYFNMRWIFDCKIIIYTCYYDFGSVQCS